MIMYHRQANEAFRPSRPFDYDHRSSSSSSNNLHHNNNNNSTSSSNNNNNNNNNNNSTSTSNNNQDRLPIRPDDRNHNNNHPTSTSPTTTPNHHQHHQHHHHHHHPHHTNTHHQQYPSHHHHHQHHLDQQLHQRRQNNYHHHHHHHHETATHRSSTTHLNHPSTTDHHHRFHPSSSDRLTRSQLTTTPTNHRQIDRRIEYPDRNNPRQTQSNLTPSSSTHDESSSSNRRIYDEPSRNHHHKSYDDPPHNRDHLTSNDPTFNTSSTHGLNPNHNHNIPATNPAPGSSSNSMNNNNHSTTSNNHRRSDEFPITNRSTRYNPYPLPSGPRADSHLSSTSRIPNGPSGYHSSSSIPTSYEDRLAPSRNHDHHIPQRTYDPNSQFNHGPPKDKSPPSQSVIFMGLPIHTDEANLRAFLEECGASVDSVTIIYDRITGQSKRYGFARFVSVDHARAFVEPAFPMVVWKEPTGSRFDRSGDGLKVKIDYSQKEKVPFEVRQREREAIPPRTTPATPFINEVPNQSGYSYNADSSVINDGARDIGGTPTSILLLRGLDPLSTEQEIAQHLQHIPDPSQTVLPESIRKVMLIKDRQTRASWGYAFVQFADVQVAVKALSLLLNTSLFPRGFQIRSRTITVTFAHEHSFHPIYTPSDWSFKGAGGQELAYWDDKAYAALYISPIAEPNHSSPTSKFKTLPQTHRSEGTGNGRHEDAEVNELLSTIDSTELQVNPSSKNNGTSTHQDTHSSSKHSLKSDTLIVEEADPGDRKLESESKLTTNYRKIEGQKLENSQIQADRKNVGEEANHQAEINHSNQKGSEIIKTSTEKKKTSVEPIATKKLVANIQKWQTKHQEIASATGTSQSEDKNQPTLTSETTGVNNNEDDFSDFNRLTCILCQRQFKSAEDLQRHNNLSNLHKTNLQNDKLKRAARLKKAASLAKKSNNSMNSNNNNSSSTTTTTSTNSSNQVIVVGEASGSSSGNPSNTTTPKYTDRAAARREAYGQPDAPNADKHEAKKARYEPAPQPILPPVQPDKDGIQATNVGSKMLEKMGWQKGEGLGNGNTNGRIEPIVATQYVKGVGLGSSTGVNVGQYDDSNNIHNNKKGFLDQVKDKTLQRFHQN